MVNNLKIWIDSETEDILTNEIFSDSDDSDVDLSIDSGELYLNAFFSSNSSQLKPMHSICNYYTYIIAKFIQVENSTFR